jgi:flagellar hook assembly protein FlgD
MFQKLLENQTSGLNQIYWSGRDNNEKTLPNGIYHCQILQNKQKLQEKIIILK